ncbi:hypothetical protein ACHAW6_001383 [Cyclotella cf. meneghiniana]
MLSLTTNFMLSKPLMVMCTFTSKRACVVFCNQRSLPRNYWRNASMHRDTINAQSQLVSGDMAGDPSPLSYV